MSSQKFKVNNKYNIIQFKVYKIDYKINKIKINQLKKINNKIIDSWKMKMEMYNQVLKHNMKIKRENVILQFLIKKGL